MKQPRDVKSATGRLAGLARQGRGSLACWHGACAGTCLFASVVTGCTLVSEDFSPTLVSLDAVDTTACTESDCLASDPAAEADPALADGGVQTGTATAGNPEALDPSTLGRAPIDGDTSASTRDEDGSPLPAPDCENGLGDFGAPEAMLVVGVNGDLYGPSLSADGLTLYFSADVAGTEHIYRATRDNRQSTVFDDATLIPEVSSPADDGTPFLGADGLRLYFYSSRERPRGDRDLWFAERDTAGAAFSARSSLSVLNTENNDLSPWLTADERSIVFVSTRPNGSGGSDLYIARRGNVDDAFGAPAPLTELNSTRNEGRAVFTRDRLSVFFSSDRAGTTADLYSASRSSTAERFSTPRALGALNSTAPDRDIALSADGLELLFASSRSGSNALWRALRGCSGG